MSNNFYSNPVKAERQRTESEPEPLPTPRLSPETVQSVLRNERLDGNFPGSPSYEAVRRLALHRPASEPYLVEGRDEKEATSWFYFENGKWVAEQDEWEFVSPDVVIRRHHVPRNSLCNPSKIKKAFDAPKIENTTNLYGYRGRED